MVTKQELKQFERAQTIKVVTQKDLLSPDFRLNYLMYLLTNAKNVHLFGNWCWNLSELTEHVNPYEADKDALRMHETQIMYDPHAQFQWMLDERELRGIENMPYVYDASDLEYAPADLQSAIKACPDCKYAKLKVKIEIIDGKNVVVYMSVLWITGDNKAVTRSVIGQCTLDMLDPTRVVSPAYLVWITQLSATYSYIHGQRTATPQPVKRSFWQRLFRQ